MAAMRQISLSTLKLAESAYEFEQALRIMTDPDEERYCGMEKPFGLLEIPHLFAQYLAMHTKLESDLAAGTKEDRQLYRNAAELFVAMAFGMTYGQEEARILPRQAWHHLWDADSNESAQESLDAGCFTKAEGIKLDKIEDRWATRILKIKNRHDKAKLDERFRNMEAEDNTF